MTAVPISRVEEKVQLLLKKMLFLQEENQRLQNTVDLQQKGLQEQKEQIKELEQKISLLKIASTTGAGSPESSVVRKELKNTINQYIREIDHCIARLRE
jgi:hypothetical protein